MKKLVALMVALTMVLGLASVASAAEYPSKGISVICPWGAGGGTDAVLRAFCEAMGKDLGVTLTVDNRTGGGGIIGHQAIADAEPDGYTIGMITFELSTYKHLGTSELTYEDYEPLCRVNTDAAAITVNAEWAKANNITDLAGFIDYCKAHPGEVQMGGSSNASVWHIAGGYLMNAADIRLQMVTYQEGAATAVPECGLRLHSGRDRVSGRGAQLHRVRPPRLPGRHGRSAQQPVPGCPDLQEQGYDIAYATQRGMAVPKGIDPAIRAPAGSLRCRG